MKIRIEAIASGLILACAFWGGSGMGEENKEPVQSAEADNILSMGTPVGQNEIWQDAYRTIICDLENNLSDPYDLRSDFNGYVYLGIHDFDNNDIPELIVGDSVSIAVFTYSDGEAVKIADLYEPDYRGEIKKLFYKNNTLLLVSNGADGNGYVCLTYDEGDYIKGFYDDHNPNIGIINENQVSKEDFEQLFIPDELMQNGSAILSQKLFCFQLNIESKTVMVSDNITEMDGLDFNMIRW